MHRSLRRSSRVAALAVVAAALAACGGDGGEAVRDITGTTAAGSGSASASGVADCIPVGDIATAERQVDLQLSEWAITGRKEAATGRIGFVAKNIGKEDHEVVVVKAASVEGLPRTDEGALDEAALATGALIGEIEPFRPGQTCSGVFDLRPGSYVLLCNIVQQEVDGTVEVHLAEGMATPFTVTP